MHTAVFLWQQRIDDTLKHTAVAYTFAYQVQQRYGYHTLVGKTFNGFLGGENTHSQHEDNR